MLILRDREDSQHHSAFIPFNIFPRMSSESGINKFNRKLYINQRGITTDSNKKHVAFPHRYLPRRSILQTTSHSVMPRGGNSIGGWFVVCFSAPARWCDERARAPWEMLPASSTPQTTAAIQRLTERGSNVYKRKTVNLYYLLFLRCYMVQCNLNIRRYLLCCFLPPLLTLHVSYVGVIWIYNIHLGLQNM